MPDVTFGQCNQLANTMVASGGFERSMQKQQLRTSFSKEQRPREERQIRIRTIAKNKQVFMGADPNRSGTNKLFVATLFDRSDQGFGSDQFKGRFRRFRFRASVSASTKR